MLSPLTKRLAHRLIDGKPADPAASSRFAAAVAGSGKKRGAARAEGTEPTDAERLAGYAQTDAERLARYAERPLADATERAYGFDWRHFSAWCAKAGRTAFPAAPETLAVYLDAHRESFAPATLSRRVVAVGAVHAEQGLPHPGAVPLVRNVLTTIRRERGTAQRQMEPLVTEDIRRMIDALPRTDGHLTPISLRDRLLILLGFAGAFRRAELVALSWNDARLVAGGLEITIRRSKTDQQGKGRLIAVPRGVSGEAYCPVAAFGAWSAATGKPKTGAIFCRVDRHANIKTTERLLPKAVAFVVKRSAVAVGLDPTLYAGHSLRAGLATSAHLGGATETAIMGQTGHKSAEMVRRYVRRANLWKNNPATATGL